MKITILGCWAPYPRAGGSCPGYLLEDGGTLVVLDLGHGAFGRLSSHCDFRKIRAVVLSHLHPDHYADIDCLRHAVEGAVRDGSRKPEPVKLFLPREPAAVAQRLAGWGGCMETVFYEDLPSKEIIPGLTARMAYIGSSRYAFVLARHTLVSYSVRIEGDCTFVYTGDTAPTGDLVMLARGADLILAEASGLDGDSGYLSGAHMTARQAGELAGQAGVKKVLLTHFWPEYDLEDLKRQAQEGYGGSLSVALEGTTYNIREG